MEGVSSHALGSGVDNKKVGGALERKKNVHASQKRNLPVFVGGFRGKAPGAQER